MEYSPESRTFLTVSMPLSRSSVQEVYTTGIGCYSSFINAFQSPQGIQALLRRSHLLRPGLRVLDAGCGFGMATFALLEALRERNLITRALMHSISRPRCCSD